MRLTSITVKTLMKGLMLFTVTVALQLFGAGQVAALPLKPGDIIVADQYLPAIIQIDPTNGHQKIISSGGLLSTPRGIALDLNGDILVAVRFGLINGVLRVDPITGDQTVVSSGENFIAPADLVLDANGDILVIDFVGKIIKVDPATGAQTVISSGDMLIAPSGIDIDTNGDILISDFGIFGVGPGSVIRVNPVTSVQTVVSSDWNFLNPVGITIDASGDILVANQGSFPYGDNNIIRVNPLTGEQTIAFFNSSIMPVAIAPDANGNILAADFLGSVARIDPLTGAHTVVSSDGWLISPAGIAIMPQPSVSTVAIDIKPGNFPNSIYPQGKTVICVAILSDDTFDATTVDPTTVLFGPTGTEASPVQYDLKDIDRDGNIDMILHFKATYSGLQCGDTVALITGLTSIYEKIEGSDSVNIVKCK